MNCNGCGVELDPSEEQVNASVDQILQTSLKDAEKKAGVCPLCGHSKEVPYSHRKTVLFGLFLACLLVSIAGGIFVYRSRQTQRNAAADEVVRGFSRPSKSILRSNIRKWTSYQGVWSSTILTPTSRSTRKRQRRR